MKLKLIQFKDRKNHGKMVDGIFYLNEGVCYTTQPLKHVNTNELFIETKKIKIDY